MEFQFMSFLQVHMDFDFTRNESILNKTVLQNFIFHKWFSVMPDLVTLFNEMSIYETMHGSSIYGFCQGPPEHWVHTFKTNNMKKGT